MKSIAYYDDKIKAFARDKSYISIPEIQFLENITYKEAKLYIDHARCRGWIGDITDGRKYPITSADFELRDIDDAGCRELVRNFSSDTAEILGIVAGNSPVSLRVIDDTVSASYDDTRRELARLIDQGLIMSDGELFYINISPSSAQRINAITEKNPPRRRFSFDF